MFVWSELKEGLRFSSNVRFAPFFFFWISAWIGRLGVFGPIQRESARFSVNRPDSEPHRCESTQVGFKKKKDTWHVAAGHAGSGVPRVLPHRTRVRHQMLHRLLECKIEVAIIFWVNDTSMLLLISIVSNMIF